MQRSWVSHLLSRQSRSSADYQPEQSRSRVLRAPGIEPSVFDDHGVVSGDTYWQNESPIRSRRRARNRIDADGAHPERPCSSASLNNTHRTASTAAARRPTHRTTRRGSESRVPVASTPPPASDRSHLSEGAPARRLDPTARPRAELVAPPRPRYGNAPSATRTSASGRSARRGRSGPGWDVRVRVVRFDRRP